VDSITAAKNYFYSNDNYILPVVSGLVKKSGVRVFPHLRKFVLNIRYIKATWRVFDNRRSHAYNNPKSAVNPTGKYLSSFLYATPAAI
jgi:hypothetical protein